MLWQHGGDEVRRALGALVEEHSLEELAARLFSFTIPLSQVSSTTLSPRSQTLILEVKGRSLRYSVKNELDLTALGQKWRNWE